MTIALWIRNHFIAVFAALSFALIFLVDPVFAHHPFALDASSDLTYWKALISGIGHPLLGPDHLLFLLGIVLVGLKINKKWVLSLLAVGMGGSAFAQLQPLSDVMAPALEVLVSFSLAIEGLIILNALSSKLLFPMFALHGYLLGSAIVGAEPTPLIGYIFGLIISQGSLLLLVTSLSQKVVNIYGINGRILFAGMWMGIGFAFSWSALIA